MSWSPDLFIGELRPWPDSVHVVRGKTDETRRYFPECKDGQEVLERRIDELCAEVERLRERLKESDDGRMRQADNLIDKCHKIARLQTENAELRKLLLDVWNDACEFDGFWDYVHDDGEIYNEDELPHYQERMRELGIEVES